MTIDQEERRAWTRHVAAWQFQRATMEAQLGLGLARFVGREDEDLVGLARIQKEAEDLASAAAQAIEFCETERHRIESGRDET